MPNYIETGYDNFLGINSLGAEGAFEESNTVTLDENVDNAYIDSVGEGRLYDAVVSLTDPKAYKTIKAALDAGKKRIFVRNGEYILKESILITEGVLIYGESQSGVVIRPKNYKFFETYHERSRYSTGTVTINSGSTSVTGSGTTFVGNVLAGDYIVVNNFPLKISQVPSNTLLVLESNYQGPVISGASYDAGPMIDGLQILNITVSPANNNVYTALMLEWCINAVIEGVTFINNGTTCSVGLYVQNSYLCEFNRVYAYGFANDGISLNGAVLSLTESKSFNNGRYGLFANFANGYVRNSFFGNNATDGVYLDGDGTSMTSVTANYNYHNGIYSGGFRNSISNCNASFNGYSGLFSDHGNVIVTGCTFRSNHESAVRLDRMARSSITANFFIENGTVGTAPYADVVARDGCQYIIISNNVFDYKSGSTWPTILLSADSSYCIVSSNYLGKSMSNLSSGSVIVNNIV